MKARIAASRKQPTLNSYYVSDFTDKTLAILKGYKPFTTYHKDLQEYEITREIYELIKEPTTSLIDEGVKPEKYERHHTGSYGYQEDAVEFAMKTDNIFLNFSQGMGKSFTTMRIIDSRGLKRVLIVCGQSNLQEEWIKDAIKHNMKEKLSFGIVGDMTGSNAKRVAWLKEKGVSNGVDVINIESLRNDAIIEQLNNRKYDCIVVDEVQSAKGWKSQQTEGLHLLERYEGQVRIALSGTPVLNNPLEFFSMLKYFGQLKDTARTTFEKYYGVWGYDFWGHYICKGYKNMEELNQLIDPVVCFAPKDELGLPGKVRKKIDLPWQLTEDYAHLAVVYKMSTKRMKKAGYTSKPQIRAQMQYLSSTADVKVDFVVEHAKTNKLLVFSQYTTVLEKYCQTLADKGLKVLFYHGQLAMKDRLQVLSDWRTGNYDVLLLSTLSARYGLNLTEASEVIFLEPPTSLAILEQAEDRAYRIGQTKVVTSYLLSVGEIDDEALENIRTKQEALDELYELRK